MRDRDRLRNAFQDLRNKNFWARADQSEGWDAVPDDILRRDGKVVFWHENETANAFNGEGDLVASLHLHHKIRDAAEIQAALQTHGLKARITGGNADAAVVVDPA